MRAPCDGGFFLGPVSRDNRYLALVKPRTTNDSDVYLYDRETRELRNLTDHTGPVSNSPATFTPDSRALLYTTDEGHEFAHLVRYDLATGEKTVVLKPDWDVWDAGYSRNGTYLVVSINNDARTELRLYEAGKAKHRSRPEVDRHDVHLAPICATLSFIKLGAALGRRWTPWTIGRRGSRSSGPSILAGSGTPPPASARKTSCFTIPGTSRPTGSSSG
jgi:dipeptidyl aminopeptidase/acylaminoacyl peptidase